MNMRAFWVVLVVVASAAGFFYCAQHAGDDVLFLDWIASSSRAEVWMFLWGAIAVGVATGRMMGGAK